MRSSADSSRRKSNREQHKMKNLATSREASNPNPVKSFAASGGEFDPNGLMDVSLA